MRGTSAARTVIRLQPLEWDTSKKTSSTLQEGSLVFSMDDMESRREAEHVDTTAREAVARVELLLRVEDDVQASLHKYANVCSQTGSGGLEGLARSLQRMGYGARVVSAPIWRNLSHSFVVVRVDGWRELIVDPGFAEQFRVATPTLRYAHLLRALPAVLVATAERTSQAAAVVAFEMARLFKHQGAELPPWRRADLVAGKWNVSRATVLAAAPAHADAKAPTHIDSSPSTDGDSPRSVLPSRHHPFTPALRTLGFKTATATARDQCVCWGLREFLEAANTRARTLRQQIREAAAAAA